ncbi:MAG: hypothetical protein Q8L68_02280 [Methylococcales bacterium]|nr:hypothetical protein [Methylococcales bacterium]
MGINNRSGNFGISVGSTFSVILLLIHAVVDWLNGGVSQGDGILWLFQIVVYFIASLIAANSQYQAQIDFNEPLLGVANAGRGAAMIVCAVMWFYIVVRSVVLDDPGMFAGGGILPFCGFVLLDFVVAVAFGNWGGRIIEKRHEHVTE